MVRLWYMFLSYARHENSFGFFPAFVAWRVEVLGHDDYRTTMAFEYSERSHLSFVSLRVGVPPSALLTLERHQVTAYHLQVFFCRDTLDYMFLHGIPILVRLL